MLQEILGRMYLGNTVKDYLVSLATFAGGLIVIRIFSTIVISRLKKMAETTTTTLDDFLIQSIHTKLSPLFYVGVLYLSLQELTLSPKVTRGVGIFCMVMLTIFGVRFVLSLLLHLFEDYWTRGDQDESKKKAMKGIFLVIKFVIWMIAGIILLDNLGIQVSALIAGLGIGGIAIALAAQTILGDLFSYFIIFFDRPFEIGDFIVLGDFSGSVERIGIKTSRLRSINGEELIFSNTDLTNSRVRNYKRMDRRRVFLKLGVTFDSTAEQLGKVPGIIEGIVREVEGTQFDRCHFSGFGESALTIEAAYYVLSPDYNTYMDIQQRINLRIMEEFGRLGIRFAFPTRTVYMARENVDRRSV